MKKNNSNMIELIKRSIKLKEDKENNKETVENITKLIDLIGKLFEMSLEDWYKFTDIKFESIHASNVFEYKPEITENDIKNLSIYIDEIRNRLINLLIDVDIKIFWKKG